MLTVCCLHSQTNPIAWANLPNHWNLALIYTLWIAIELAFVYFVYIETKGSTLEEIAKLFDGDNAVAHVDMAEVERDAKCDASFDGSFSSSLDRSKSCR